MEQFKADRTYTAKSACNQDTVFSFTVTRRTAKSVWIVGESIKEETRRSIKVYDGQECIMPLGSYSMAPMLRASRIKPLETVKTLTDKLEKLYKSEAYREGITWAAIKACELREKIVALVGAYVPPTQEETDAKTPTRTWENAMKNGFTSCPGDIYTIRHTSGVISSTITFELRNDRRGERCLIAVDNKLDSWVFFKKLAAINGRTVNYQIDQRHPIPFIGSVPYLHRFA